MTFKSNSLVSKSGWAALFLLSSLVVVAVAVIRSVVVIVFVIAVAVGIAGNITDNHVAVVRVICWIVSLSCWCPSVRCCL